MKKIYRKTKQKLNSYENSQNSKRFAECIKHLLHKNNITDGTKRKDLRKDPNEKFSKKTKIFKKFPIKKNF